MAQQRNELQRERFCCSICLDLLKDPGTLLCGHSYCMNCIKSHWDKEDERRIFSCPQCRKTFIPRPELMKSTMLADLVEELKKTGIHAAPADLCCAGAEDVACDVCTGRKHKALKSCLVCLASYCEEHLQPHHQSPAFKKHKLVEPSKNLQENICPRHDEVMKMFCRTDQQCVCYLCSGDEHKDHDTVSAAAERTQKQRELDLSREEIQQRVQDIDRDVKVLQQEVEALTLSADKAVKDTEKTFTEMMLLLQKRSSDVKQQIRSQQETEVSRVKDLQEKLQQELTELNKREAELKQLSLTHDHNQFLRNYRSLSALSPSTHSSTVDVRPLRHFEDVTVAVAEVKGQIQDVLTETWTNISLAVTQVDVLLTEPEPEPEPKTRAEFLRYSQKITLDPNTAHTQLLLSEGNRKVTFMKNNQSYPRQTDRFAQAFVRQVLSKESLNGRCYWEVEWTGKGVSVAVTYNNISRSDGCEFGYNDKSWMFILHQNICEFVHNSIKTKVSGGLSSRVGVYLDHRAGLSFYSVSDTMTLLHRVQPTFTQPLYAGVRLYYDYGNTAEFCKLK
ncbi:tripartite motif-containing protein 16-like [Solea solea]|uniref:tripartite motif-containing protein 16-like n=1 Tax=Solea solea TaxID=90069 RepID=UPI00272B3AE3|nr:tripartite motif-containing protein 16-like [Solea solea]